MSNTIHWVFGGTCVGKKHFIRAAVEHPQRFGLPAGLVPACYADGTTEPKTVIAQAAAAPLIVRWQWGREGALREIVKLCPDIRHVIYLCRVYPSVQVRRVIEREGHLKWDEPTLIREAEDVLLLVEKLSMAHAIPVRFIDATENYAA